MHMQRNASVMPINDDVLHLRLLRRSDGHSLFGARRDATASDARQARAEATLARAVDEQPVFPVTISMKTEGKAVSARVCTQKTRESQPAPSRPFDPDPKMSKNGIL